MRTARTNGSTAYSYVYNGSQLSQMTVGGNTLYFAYDASGTPLSVTYNGTAYYYATNLQGDVTAILNTSGTAVVTYTYDAWGNILTTGGSMASTLGTHNPLRYRGYVYDTETGLYYLQSRYYDPEMGRFFNADALIATGQGLLGNNMFAYCLNNPVIRRDTSGTEGVCVENFDDDHNPLNDLGNPTGGGGGSSGIWQSFTRTLKYAADGLKMASGQRDLAHVEDHHIITNKHQTEPVKYKEIADQYNYSLDHPSNIVSLPGHRGRHTNAYHAFVNIAITELDVIAAGNTDVFIKGMGILGEFIKQNWWIPYAQYK